ncbi:MAG: hypothetical protein ABR582_16030 [Gemmatimonadaceae bacterium]
MLVLLASRAQADLPRHPLSGPPRTARGVVERILLLREQQLILHEGNYALDGIVALQGGVLMPVSEDRDYIYYQAPNGIWVRDQNSSSFLPLGGILYPGGLFFSKTKPDGVYAYTGDARKQKEYLDRDWRPLAPKALAALQVGQLAKPTTKAHR